MSLEYSTTETAYLFVRRRDEERVDGKRRTRKRYELCSSLAAIVDGDVNFWEHLRVDAHLVIIAAAERETKAIFRNGNGMEASASDLNNSVIRASEVGDFGRDTDNVSISAFPINASTRLSMAVETPCPDLVLVVNCK